VNSDIIRGTGQRRQINGDNSKKAA